MEGDQKSNPGYTLRDWQSHYDSGDLKWDLGQVSPPFVRLWEDNKLQPGKAIVPGCGRGHEVVFLAQKGFEVTAVDFAPGAVQALTLTLNHNGLEGRILHQDFFELDSSHDNNYDLMLEQTFFCAINPDQRAQYVDTALRILKKGGLLAGLFYHTKEKGGPPFNTTKEDVIQHFSSCFDIEFLEKTPHSFERRKGKEWLGLLRKK